MANICFTESYVGTRINTSASHGKTWSNEFEHRFFWEICSFENGVQWFGDVFLQRLGYADGADLLQHSTPDEGPPTAEKANVECEKENVERFAGSRADDLRDAIRTGHHRGHRHRLLRHYWRVQGSLGDGYRQGRNPQNWPARFQLGQSHRHHEEFRSNRGQHVSLIE